MTAIVVLADGFEEIEAVTPVDLLRRAGVRVVVAGLTGLTVVGARGTGVVCDSVLSDVAPGWDAIILPGGMPGAKNLAESALVNSFLEKTLASGGTIGAICAAPSLVLGGRGFLHGRSYTGYPGMPPVEGARYLEEPVVVDGPVITSRGVGTAADFALKLVEVLVGREKAAEVARATLLA